VERRIWVEHPSYRHGSKVKNGPPPWAPAHGRRVKY
jgi:hypothetical protein